MIRVADILTRLHLPVGFPLTNGKTVTQADVINWRNNGNINPIKNISYITLLGITSSIIGTIISFFKNTALKTISIILTLGGIGTIIYGIIGQDKYNSGVKTDTSNKNKNTTKESLSEPGAEYWTGILADKTKSALERSNAAKVLGNKKEKSAVNSLIKYLDDDLVTVQTTCAWALGEIADNEAINALGKIAKADPRKISEKLIKTAKAAIRKINKE